MVDEGCDEVSQGSRDRNRHLGVLGEGECGIEFSISDGAGLKGRPLGLFASASAETNVAEYERPRCVRGLAGESGGEDGIFPMIGAVVIERESLLLRDSLGITASIEFSGVCEIDFGSSVRIENGPVGVFRPVGSSPSLSRLREDFDVRDLGLRKGNN